MSDYILNNEISGKNSDIVYEKKINQLNNNFVENGNCAQKNVFEQYEDVDERNVLLQWEMFSQKCPQSDEDVFTENIDVCYERELKRLSSSLIQLRRNARQKHLQEKATCGISQVPHLVKSSNSYGDTNPSLDIQTERQFILHPNSRVETGIAEYGTFAEPGIIIPALLDSRETTFTNEKATCGISQLAHLVKSSNSYGDTNPSLDIQTERQFILHPNSRVETGIAEYGTFAEPGIIIPALLDSTETTFTNTDALSDCMYLQTDETARTNQIPGVSGSRMSAQTLVTPMSDKRVEGDRQRQHSRNKREKKRRSAITDSITELGNLLPKELESASCWKKGAVLAKSIDYIKRLKDQNRIQQLDDKLFEANMELNSLRLRIQRVESGMNISSPNQNQI